MISKRALILLFSSLVRLAGANIGLMPIVDDTIDLIQYVGSITSDEHQDTTKDEINFLGEKIEVKRKEKYKIILTFSTMPKNITAYGVNDFDQEDTQNFTQLYTSLVEDDSGGDLLEYEAHKELLKMRLYLMFSHIPHENLLLFV